MKIDHIFICSDNHGHEADQLVEMGLVEGSSRIHRGQGTRNRKFYFHNFFLEILWMHNEREILNDRTAPTKLWNRINYKKSGYTPFGLCLTRMPDTDPLFANCLLYTPAYFPEDKPIEFLTHESQPLLPATFRLPFPKSANPPNEPLHHPIKIKQLTKATFGVPSTGLAHPFTQFFQDVAQIEFQLADQPILTLEFDEGRQGINRQVDELSLVIRY